MNGMTLALFWVIYIAMLVAYAGVVAGALREIWRFNRWSEERARDNERRHTEAMNARCKRFERTHAASPRS